MRIDFTPSYVLLPPRFHARVTPTPVKAPRLIRVNDALAEALNLDPDSLRSDDGLAMLSGNRLPDNADSIATAYAGHQFGGFVPQLGDGRAILVGEVIGRDKERRDIQLKGAGPTPFSRRGDGRAALGPVLREYIVSEAMAALGIRTTRALAAVTTGEQVVRERMLPGAVLTRVASSHIRVGTFQYFAARNDYDGVKLLADHVIARHYPHAVDADNAYRALLDGVVAAQAKLVADWMLVGFIHGVMNTDNMSIAGETIDYGPCAFMDSYNPATVYSAIDQYGRYAYSNQPPIAEWNLARLAECLLPLLDDDADAAVADAQASLSLFRPAYADAYVAGMRRKLGLMTEEEGDVALAGDLLDVMTANEADYTLTFRGLIDCDVASSDDDVVRTLFFDPPAFDAWAARWRARLAKEPQHADARVVMMRSANPAFIPRNHRVEAVIRAAEDRDDFAPFEELLTVLSRPYDDQPHYAHYALPPEPHERVLRTFCGT